MDTSIQKEWQHLRKLRTQFLSEQNFPAAKNVEKRLKELKPKLQNSWSKPPARHTNTTANTAANTRGRSVRPTTVTPEVALTTDPPVPPRFHFYLVAVPTSHLDQLCHALFAQWLSHRGFKRQTSAEKLADYRRMITCIICNLAYYGSVRVSRDKVDYARAVSHYRPSAFNKRFLSVLDDLHTMSVIVQTKGKRYKRNYAQDFGDSKAKFLTQDSILTRLVPSHSLAVQLKGIDRHQVNIQTDLQEVVMLKRDSGSELVEYEETKETEAFRRQIKTINAHLAAAGAFLTEEGASRFDDRKRFLVRKFTYGSFEKGGRLWGGLWDAPMKRTERPDLLRICGERVAEVDFDCAIIHLAYALHGDEPPRQADMYAIPGLHPDSRPGIKTFISAHLFRESNRQRFPKNSNGRSVQEDFHPSDRTKSYSQILELIARVHPALVQDFFGTGVGHHLQYLESQLMVAILLRCYQRGLICLPLHDALIVREDQAEMVGAIMEGASATLFGRRFPVSIKGVETGGFQGGGDGLEGENRAA